MFLSEYGGIELSEPFGFDACYTLDNLIQSVQLSKRGTSWKGQVQDFCNSLVWNCMKLLKELREDTYSMREPFRFVLNERGKVRNIKALAFPDRVVQRCICDNVLVPLARQIIIDDNSACLQGRGLSYAIERLTSHLRDADPSCYILKFDFHDYFNSLDSRLVYMFLEVFVKDPKLLDVFEVILTDNEGGDEGFGLELGSPVSQVCGVMFPDIMDKRILGFPGVLSYHRYMDDGIVVCRGKATAKKLQKNLFHFVKVFGLTLNEAKTNYFPITRPFTFCQRVFQKNVRDGSVSIHLRQKALSRSIKHITRVLESHWDVDIVPLFCSTLGYWNSADDDYTQMFFGYLDRLYEDGEYIDTISVNKSLWNSFLEGYERRPYDLRWEESENHLITYPELRRMQREGKIVTPHGKLMATAPRVPRT